MEYPKVTPFDKEGQSGVIRLIGPGWVVTSGNISTGSGIGKFPLDPFHHQLTPRVWNVIGDERTEKWDWFFTRLRDT